MSGNTTPMVKLLENFFSLRPIRSAVITSEPVLSAAFEFLWFEEMQCVFELQLIEDPTKRQGDGRYRFPDIFVGNSQRQLGAANSVVVMELKNVTLRSLWKAKQRNPKAEPTTNTDFETLLSELKHATEDQLLDLKYTFLDKAKDTWVTEEVKGTLQAGIDQLNRYINIISQGQGGSASPGVSDHRLLCQKEGRDVLQGYVVICVGGTRVICRQTATRPTQLSYEVIPEELFTKCFEVSA